MTAGILDRDTLLARIGNAVHGLANGRTSVLTIHMALAEVRAWRDADPTRADMSLRQAARRRLFGHLGAMPGQGVAGPGGTRYWLVALLLVIECWAAVLEEGAAP